MVREIIEYFIRFLGFVKGKKVNSSNPEWASWALGFERFGLSFERGHLVLSEDIPFGVVAVWKGGNFERLWRDLKKEDVEGRSAFVEVLLSDFGQKKVLRRLFVVICSLEGASLRFGYVNKEEGIEIPSRTPLPGFIVNLSEADALVWVPLNPVVLQVEELPEELRKFIVKDEAWICRQEEQKKIQKKEQEERQGAICSKVQSKQNLTQEVQEIEQEVQVQLRQERREKLKEEEVHIGIQDVREEEGQAFTQERQEVLEKVGVLEGVLKEIKDGALNLCRAVEELRREGFYIIPSEGKKPTEKYRTDELKEKANRLPVKDEASLILPDWLRIVDIDEMEKFVEVTGITEEELLQIATVRTARGYHIYLISDDFSFVRGLREAMGIEILGGIENDIVVCPGSVVEGIRYEVVNPKIWTKEELIEKNLKFKLFFEQVRRFLENREKEAIGGDGVVEVFGVDAGVDLELLKEILRPYYVKGYRQTLILYLSGFLAKFKISEKQVVEVVKSLCVEFGDEEVRQRISAVRNTFKRLAEGRPVKGILGLVEEFGIPKMELMRAVLGNERAKLYREFAEKFVVEDGMILRRKLKGRNEIVGPAIQPIVKLRDEEGRVSYIVRHGAREFILEEISDLSKIEAVTGLPVVSSKDYKLALSYLFQGLNREERIVRTTGWQGDKFYHPALEMEKVRWDFERVRWLLNLKERRGVEMQHEIVKQALKEGRLLGMFYSVAVSSILLFKIGCSPFVVFLSGPSGVGKTTLSQLACSLFYNSEELFVTSYTTEVGLELFLTYLKDLPVLFDELAISSVDLERVVFLIPSQRAKMRGRKDLTVNLDKVRSVCFFTSEIQPEIDFKTLGAARRMLSFTVGSWEQVTGLFDVEEAARKVKREMYGAGVDFLSILNERKIAVEASVGRGFYYSGIATAVFSAIKFLEKFYDEEFSELRKRWERYFQDLEAKFGEKGDLISKFRISFLNWLAENEGRFLDDEKRLRGIARGFQQVMGKFVDGGVFVLNEAFEKFCREKSFHKDLILKELAERGILKMGKDGRFVRRLRVGKELAYGYLISLQKLREGEDADTEDLFRDEDRLIHDILSEKAKLC